MSLDIAHSVCPHDCPSTCALEVERLDARRIGKVRGARGNDYTAGVICAKVARYQERIHHPGRLGQPLRRVGEKGGGEFQPISWDDALDDVAEAGWLGWVLHAMDAMQDRRSLGLETLSMRASDYFRRQGALTFSDDPIALRNIEFTGTECLMWGNDFPHDEGTYPNSEKFRAEVRASVSEAEAHAIFAGNAARVYGFDLEALAREAESGPA